MGQSSKSIDPCTLRFIRNRKTHRKQVRRAHLFLVLTVVAFFQGSFPFLVICGLTSLVLYGVFAGRGGKLLGTFWLSDQTLAWGTTSAKVVIEQRKPASLVLSSGAGNYPVGVRLDDGTLVGMPTWTGGAEWYVMTALRDFAGLSVEGDVMDLPAPSSKTVGFFTWLIGEPVEPVAVEPWDPSDGPPLAKRHKRF